jgi:hypothetical protein
MLNLSLGLLLFQNLNNEVLNISSGFTVAICGHDSREERNSGAACVHSQGSCVMVTGRMVSPRFMH